MRYWLILFLVAFLSSSAVGADDLTLASWDVRLFSTGSRTDTDLALIADRLEPYDRVVILRAGAVCAGAISGECG